MAIDDSFETILDVRTRLKLNRKNVYRLAFTNEKFQNTAGAAVKIKYGSILTAIVVSTPTVEDHDGPWDDSEWEALTDSATNFTVDQKKRFKFTVPTEVIDGSPVPLIEEASTNAAEAGNIVVDNYVAATFSQITGNVYGNSTTPIVVGFGTGEVLPTDALANLFETLATGSAPLQGANVVVPWWFATFLKQEIGQKVVSLQDIVNNGQGNVSQMDLQALVAHGIGGFANIYASVAVPNTTNAKYKIMAGGPFISFAMALQTVKVVDIQNDFATGVKGLIVYGAKNMNTGAMALGTFNKGTAKVNA